MDIKVEIQRSLAEKRLATYFASVMAASVAELGTYPADLVKTRLQIQGESGDKGPHRSMSRTVVCLVREEGFFKLWRGMLPGIYRHVVYSGGRMMTYDTMRKNLYAKDKPRMWESVVMGATAGGLSQWLASPIDLVKTQLQMEGRRTLMGMKPRFNRFSEGILKIYKEGGLKSLWKGSTPGTFRAACVTIGDVSGYDNAKRFIIANTNLKDGILLHFVSSSVAGLLAAILGTPADVIKSRVMNQPTDQNGRGLLYKGPIDCLRVTIRNEGPFALYKGFLPLWMRLGPWAVLFWISYERFHPLFGGSNF